LRAAYERGVTDEFVPPIVLRAGTRIRPNDAVICFNFREDGLKQFVKILAGAETLSPQEPPPPQNVYIATFTRYAADINVGVAFPAEETRQSLSEALSAYGVQQVKIAEVKKVAHVSYFFNGGREESFPFESRIVIPSPTEADASTAPSDTAAIATGEEVVRLVERTAAECIVANFATADHALHTGNFKATIRAVEASIYAAGYPVDAAAVLLIELDGFEAGLEDDVDLVAALCRDAGSRTVQVARDDAHRARLIRSVRQLKRRSSGW